MCFKTSCKECGKYTWAGKLNILCKEKEKLMSDIGCGKHIEQALAGLKDDEICKCKKQEKTETQ
jgi:hypothetical protein